MCKKFFLTVCALTFLFFINVSAQEAKDKIDPDNYEPDFLGQLIADSINKLRVEKKLDSLFVDEVLISAAADQAIYMAKKGEVNIEQSKSSKKTTGKRVRFYGGSSDGSDEIVLYANSGRGKEKFSYEQVAGDLATKMAKNKKMSTILLKSNYIYVGAAAAMDETRKKIYISIVMGNEESITSGK